jgi:DNA-binding Lrp family transcriptional regulator
MLTELEKQVIKAVQEDIPVTRRPFLKMAQNLGISEERFLEVLQNLCDQGIIRRLGATLRHQQSGFTANAMVAWRVDEDRVARVGRIMASFPEVSHCYRRDPKPDWPYNLYTMIHARDEVACLETARKMAQKTGVDTYTLLFSKKELKKTSMKYFALDEDF